MSRKQPKTFALGSNPASGGQRAMLLAAASKMFADCGFEGTSTRAIASLAGAHQQQIAYYFGTKEQLWQEAVRLIFDDFQARVVSQIDLAEPGHEVRLRKTVEAYLKFCRDNPDFAALTMWDRTGPRAEWLEEEIISPMMRSLHFGIFHKRMEDNPPALSLILVLCEASNVFAVRRHLERGFAVDVSGDEFVDQYISHVVAMLYPLSLMC